MNCRKPRWKLKLKLIWKQVQLEEVYWIVLRQHSEETVAATGNIGQCFRDEGTKACSWETVWRPCWELPLPSPIPCSIQLYSLLKSSSVPSFIASITSIVSFVTVGLVFSAWLIWRGLLQLFPIMQTIHLTKWPI